jgi:S-adenosylmethionine decarboxylase
MPIVGYGPRKEVPSFFSCNFVKTRYKAFKQWRSTEVGHRPTTFTKGGRSLQALGRHLLIELHGCNPELLKKVDVVKEILVSAAKACKATIVHTSFHEFNPFGVSGVVVIAESHFSIHTWPEYRYAAVDIFTCGDVIKPEEAVDYIASRFRCKKPSVLEMRRGIIPGHVGKLLHKLPASTGKPVDADQELSLVH